jgi:hypothetical protein
MKRNYSDRGRPGSLLLLLANLLLASPGVLAQDYSLDWFTIDGGGGEWSDGYYTVAGTIGQPDAGEWSDGYYTIVGGFWSDLAVVPTPGAPGLSIHRTGTNAVVLSWPAPAPGWVLQESSNLPRGPWFTIIPPLAQAEGRLQATLPKASGKKFYRLKQQADAPVLTVERTGTNTLISWLAPAPGWVLEQCSPSDGGLWTLPSAPLAQVGEWVQVVLPASAGEDFYRLTMAPILTITTGPANSLVVSWMTSAVGWVLLECPTLSSNTWTTVTTPPVETGPDTMTVTLSSTGNGRLFRLAQASPAPRLSVRRSASRTVVISWPAPAIGWVLEESPTLNGSPWITVTIQPARVGDTIQVTISPAMGSRFYRLHRP